MTNSLNKILRKLADLGILLPMVRRVSKHQTHKHNPGRKRLQIARGAGSISAKADILQLARASRWNEAADMDQEHEHRCGERLFGPAVRKQWRQYAVEEALRS